jgi:hypothetical protein
VTHDDFISVDYTDPNRQTMLVGGHEQSQSVWKSTNAGSTWTNIGTALPTGTGFRQLAILIFSACHEVWRPEGSMCGAQQEYILPRPSLVMGPIAEGQIFDRQ